MATNPTVCVRCDRDIWPEDYHWYDAVSPEHCIYCAPETCGNCRIRREINEVEVHVDED